VSITCVRRERRTPQQETTGSLCGRYTLTVVQEQLAEEFDLMVSELIEPRYNIAPTQLAPVVRMMESDLLSRWAPPSELGEAVLRPRLRSRTTRRSPGRRGIAQSVCGLSCSHLEPTVSCGGPVNTDRKRPARLVERQEKVVQVLVDYLENIEPLLADLPRLSRDFR